MFSMFAGDDFKLIHYVYPYSLSCTNMNISDLSEPSSSKQLSTVAAVDSRFGLYHVAVVLSLILYAVSALH